MPDTWFTADFHFGHNNIIRYCNRQSQSVEELDQTILERLNASVKANDTLYFLGDFCIGSKVRALERRRQIRCKKIIAVPGNHDKEAQKLTEEFSWLNNLAEVLLMASPSSSVTMPCGCGTVPMMDRGTCTDIPTEAFLKYRLRFPWMSGWTPTTFAHGISTKSGR